MYEIYVNNNMLHSNHDIDGLIQQFNKILSNFHDYKIPLNVVVNNNSIIIHTNDNVITLKNEDGINFDENSLYLLPFFILNYKIISQLNINKLKEIIKLNPYYLLDIMTFTDSMLDPYYLLIKLFKVNEEVIYQTFILYLNKTITIHNKSNQVNINTIINSFFYMKKNVTDINKYYKLFSFYLSNKKLLPFMINFTPYISYLLV